MNTLLAALVGFFRGRSRARSTVLAVLFAVVLAGILAYGYVARSGTASETASATPTIAVYLPYTPNVSSGGGSPGASSGGAQGEPAPTASGGISGLPTVAPNVGAVSTIPPTEAQAPVAEGTPTVPVAPEASGSATSGQYKVYFPLVGGGPPPSTPTIAVPTPTVGVPTPTPVPAQAAAGPTAVPTPTRAPIRITKLGLGVYDSGGAMLPALILSRPSVILLQDPTVDFAQSVRQQFPNAFIVGRVFSADQPLDNPTQRGHDFADRVAGIAVPLKGVVNAWISYNEVASSSDPSRLQSYCAFQVAFANHLQNDYGIAAVAANDGPRAVTAADYVRYCGDAIRVSKYFGFHLYPNPNVTSLRDPSAADQVFYYRQIHDALVAAGISPGPFIATEVGLYNGWRGVTSDTSMGQDFVWLADQMNQDPYVLGECVYGLFLPGRWTGFNIDDSNILQTMGDYNTVH